MKYQSLCTYKANYISIDIEKFLLLFIMQQFLGVQYDIKKTTSIQHRAYSWTDRYAHLSVKPMSVNILYKIRTNSNDTCTNK